MRKIISLFGIERKAFFAVILFDFNSFCKAYKFSGTLCYNALLLLDRNSVINLSRQFRNKVTVQFVIPNAALFNYLDTHKDLSIIVKSMLRMYGGIMDHETQVNVGRIAEKTSLSETSLIMGLQRLEADDVISLSLSRTDAQVTFIEPREDNKTINRIASVIEQQNQLKQKHRITLVYDYTERIDIRFLNKAIKIT